MYSAPPLPFQMGVPAQDAFPAKLWARVFTASARAEAFAPATYADPRGEPALREQNRRLPRNRARPPLLAGASVRHQWLPRRAAARARRPPRRGPHGVDGGAELSADARRARGGRARARRDRRRRRGPRRRRGHRARTGRRGRRRHARTAGSARRRALAAPAAGAPPLGEARRRVGDRGRLPRRAPARRARRARPRRDRSRGPRPPSRHVQQDAEPGARRGFLVPRRRSRSAPRTSPSCLAPAPARATQLALATLLREGTSSVTSGG